MFKNITKTRNFRIGLGVFLFACCGLSYLNGSQLREERATETHIAKFTEVVIAVSEQAAGTQAAMFAPTATETPIPLPTNTPTNIPPTATPQPADTAAPTATQQPPTMPASTNTPVPPTNAPAQTFYVGIRANVRECPQTTCTIIRELASGAVVQVVGQEQGESFSNSTLWYILDDGNYVHSSTVSQTPPVQPQQSGGGSASSGGGGFVTSAPVINATPRNCDEARAMGLTSQQAAQYSHLDADHDGRACER